MPRARPPLVLPVDEDHSRMAPSAEEQDLVYGRLPSARHFHVHEYDVGHVGEDAHYPFELGSHEPAVVAELDDDRVADLAVALQPFEPGDTFAHLPSDDGVDVHLAELLSQPGTRAAHDRIADRDDGEGRAGLQSHRS